MSNISLTFVAHQPNRLIHYDFFKIGEHAFYEDDDLNARVLSTVAERCYFPATRLMKQLIELTGGKFRFGLALSGVILEQALYHSLLHPVHEQHFPHFRCASAQSADSL